MSLSTSNGWDSKVKPVEIVYDEERIKILIDDTRKRILSVLSSSDQDLSVSEIADKLRTNPQRIYHHVDKLVQHNFLMKTREERKKRSITTYYARSAEAFVVSYSTDRGYIHHQALIDHFISSFRTILNLDLSVEEELQLGDDIKKLADISDDVFSKYSSLKNDEDIQRHAIENLYFLLEYMIFMSNPKAKELITRITDMIEPKLNTGKEDEFQSLKY